MKDNGRGSQNATIASVAQQALDENAAELQQIAVRLCRLLPVGGIFTFAVQVVSPLSGIGGEHRIMANEMVQVTRPAVALGRTFSVKASEKDA